MNFQTQTVLKPSMSLMPILGFKKELIISYQFSKLIFLISEINK